LAAQHDNENLLHNHADIYYLICYEMSIAWFVVLGKRHLHVDEFWILTD
jgi:hypothetical protein